IIPSVIPLADFFMIVGLITGNAAKIGTYYIIFMLVDVAVAILAFSFEKERKWALIWLIPQMLVWRWLMWGVFFKAGRRAIKGELQNWCVLKRTGNDTPHISHLQTNLCGINQINAHFLSFSKLKARMAT